MARYTGSPWGTIHGKLGNIIGFQWKGIHVAKKYHSTPAFTGIAPTAVKDIFRIIQKFVARHFASNIQPIWEVIAKRSKLPVLGGNLLLKKSARVLYKSTNAGIQDPDMTLFQVSNGKLEPSLAITGATYTPASGQLVVTWNTNVFTNGDASDDAVLVLYRSAYTGHPEGNSWLLGTGVTRGTGTATVWTQPNLPSGDLTVFLYFWDGACHYSPSTDRGRAILQARDHIHQWKDPVTTTSSTFVKVISFNIYREVSYKAYKLYCLCKNATLYFRLKSGIEGDLDSNEVSGVATESKWKTASLNVSAQNEYITVEIYAKNLGSGTARLESGLFYGFL